MLLVMMKVRNQSQLSDTQNDQFHQDVARLSRLPSQTSTASSRRRPALAKGLLPLAIVLDDQRAGRVGAEPPPPLHGQLVGELEATGALHGFDGDLEVGDGLGVVDGGVGQDKGANGDIAAGPAVLGEDDLVEVRGHGDGGRSANHLVLDVPLVVDGVLLGQIQGPRDDAHGGVPLRQAPAKVLKVRPVVAVEALTDLGAHVGQVKRLVHGGLRPLCVRRGDLVAPVVATAVVVLEQGAELCGHARVLEELAVLAVAVPLGQGLGGDVLDDPVGVAHAPVVARDEGGAAGDVGDGAGEAIFEQAAWVDGRRAQGRRGSCCRSKDLVGWDCSDGGRGRSDGSRGQ